MQQIVLENWVFTYERMKLDSYLIQYTKFTSKWIKDLNIRNNTIKLLQENIGEKLHDTGFGNDSKHHQQQNRCWSSSKLKTSVIKRHYQQNEKETHRWEKIC